jgi:4,4'-diaponeurosporenoate glycosyltransferase
VVDVVLLLCWLAGWLLLWRVPQLPAADERPSGTVSVVISAGHDEDAVSRLRASLAAQTEPPDEVIVVDDDTESRREGARRATGEWLVLLDAGVELAPDALNRMLAAHTGTGMTVVSVTPYHVVHKALEHLSLFFDLLATMATVMGALGACLVVRREDYLAAGAHEAVRKYGGRRAVSFRMAPQGLKELAEGWGENFVIGAAATPAPRLLLMSVWVSGCLAVGFIGLGVPYLAFAIQVGVMAIQLGSFSAFAIVLFPIPLAVFLAILVRTLVRSTSHRGIP